MKDWDLPLPKKSALAAFGPPEVHERKVKVCDVRFSVAHILLSIIVMLEPGASVQIPSIQKVAQSAIS